MDFFCVIRRFSITPFLLIILPAAFLFLGHGTADLKHLDKKDASDEEEGGLMSKDMVFSLAEVLVFPMSYSCQMIGIECH